MCYTVQGPHVESLINHPVCRPALSIGAEWPLFHHWCLLHVNTSAVCSSFFFFSSFTCASRRASPAPAAADSGQWMILSPAAFRMPEKGGRMAIGEGAAGGGGCSEVDVRTYLIFVFSQAALLWPGQCNVSVTPVANMSVCSLSAIK